MARNSETQALIERIESSRRHLGHEVVGLREKLDFPKQLKRRVVRNPWLLFGASATGGLILSRLIFRPRRDKKRRSGMPRLLMATLPAILKPLIKSLLNREIQRRLHGATQGPTQPDRFPLSNS